MEERRTRLLALGCSMIGVLLLYISSSLFQAPSAIVTTGVDDIGSSLTACGNTSSFKTNRGHVFFDISDNTGKIKVVAFNTTAVRLNLSKGVASSMCISGQVAEFPQGSGELEIILKKVVV
jgi:exonuclease VII large subunit